MTSFNGARARGVSPIVAVLLGLAAIAGACGIPVNDEVEVLAQGEHFELLNGTTSTTALEVAEPDDPESFPVDLYFVLDNRLEVVSRPFLTAPSGNELLAALESGPVQGEIDLFEGSEELQSLLPAGLTASFGPFEGASQQIMVNPEAELRQRVEEQPEVARLIVSQIVCTVVSFLTDVEVSEPEATEIGVELFDGEERIPLSDSASQPIGGPANVGNFDACITGTALRQEQVEAEAENQSTSTTGN
jgi:hypothetical protein